MLSCQIYIMRRFMCVWGDNFIAPLPTLPPFYVDGKFEDNFYVYFLWHFCSLFDMTTPHLSPSPLSTQFAPPPPPLT